MLDDDDADCSDSTESNLGSWLLRRLNASNYRYRSNRLLLYFGYCCVVLYVSNAVLMPRDGAMRNSSDRGMPIPPSDPEVLGAEKGYDLPQRDLPPVFTAPSPPSGSKWLGHTNRCDVRTPEGLASCDDVQRQLYERLALSTDEALLLHQFQLEQMLIMSRTDHQVRAHMKHSNAVYEWFMVRIRIYKQLTGCSAVKAADVAGKCVTTLAQPQSDGANVLSQVADEPLLREMADFFASEGITSLQISLGDDHPALRQPPPSRPRSVR